MNAKFGGATHDAHIWSSSRAESYMRELHQNNEQVWLLGMYSHKNGRESALLGRY